MPMRTVEAAIGPSQPRIRLAVIPLHVAVPGFVGTIPSLRAAAVSATVRRLSQGARHGRAHKPDADPGGDAFPHA